MTVLTIDAEEYLRGEKHHRALSRLVGVAVLLIVAGVICLGRYLFL